MKNLVLDLREFKKSYTYAYHGGADVSTKTIENSMTMKREDVDAEGKEVQSYICIVCLFVLSEDLMNFLIKGSLISKNIQGDNPLLKKLEKVFCLKLFSIQGTAQDRCDMLFKAFCCRYSLPVCLSFTKRKEANL